MEYLLEGVCEYEIVWKEDGRFTGKSPGKVKSLEGVKKRWSTCCKGFVNMKRFGRKIIG